MARKRLSLNRILKTNAEARSLAREIVEDQRKVDEFQEEVKKLAHEHGIDVVQYELPMKRQRVLDYMGKKGMTRLDLGEDGYVNFIQAIGEHIWVVTDADLSNDGIPKGAKSLRRILGKELFMRATKRVADPKAIEQLVEEGEITEEEISLAHYIKKRAPYIKFERGRA